MGKSLFMRILIYLLIFSLMIGPSFGSAKVFAEDNSIKDWAKSSAYAKKAIAELVDKGIITGDENGNFNPKQNVTRAQMAAIVVRALNLNIADTPDKATFKDIPKNHWAFPYVEAAYKKGIITGLSKDTFGADELCTREQMTAMLVRSLGISRQSINENYINERLNKLADKEKVSSWSRDYVGLAISMKLMNGTSRNTFDPKAYSSKEQAAAATDRFLSIKLSAVPLAATGTSSDMKKAAALEESVVLITTYDKDGVPFAQGSGFAVANGLILTNYHVIDGASKYTITDSNGKDYDMEGTVKYDANLDLAIIKSKQPLTIKPLELGSKNSLSKGEAVAVIGSPQGLLNSFSNGVVTGFDETVYGIGKKLSVIKFAADVTHGSSGGPLFDMSGKVVGIVSAMDEEGKEKYAIAIDHAKGWIDDLKTKAFDDIAVLDMTKAIDTYWKAFDGEVKATVYDSFNALEQKDVDAYIDTIHKLNPAYKTIRQTYGKLLSIYDFDYTIKSIDIYERSFDEVKLNVIYTVKKSGKKESTNMEVKANYYLAPEDGRWKIFYANESWSLLDGSSYLTGVDLVSGQESGSIPSEPEVKDIEPVMKEAPLQFNVTDAVMDSVKPIVYITDKANKKVIAYNYNSKTYTERTFTLPPESIDMENNELYVALLKGQHSYSVEPKDQKGAIAILDSDTLNVKEQFDINIDPYDIEVSKDGYIYVSPGSGWSSPYIKSYSRQTLQEVSYGTMGAMNFIKLNEFSNKIYTNSYSGISVYNVSKGQFKDPYRGGVSATVSTKYGPGETSSLSVDGTFSLSPDGKYMFNSSGTVFTLVPDSEGIVKYRGSLAKSFKDIAFDPAGNRFFTALKGGVIYENNYSSLEGIAVHQVQGEIIRLYYQDNKLIALTKANDKYYAEIVELAR